MKVRATAIIEKGEMGYDITLKSKEGIPFGLLGQGRTVEEAKEDFINSYEEMMELMNDEGIECPELEFEFLFDTASFLTSVSSTFTMAGLSKITGVNRKQLGHYVQGTSKPSAKTATRIQESIISYVNEIAAVRFV